MNDFRPAGSTSAAPSGAAGGDLSGTYPNPTVAKLNGTAAASYALLAGPTFTGSPVLPTGTTGTTQTINDVSTKLATTAYVDRMRPASYYWAGNQANVTSTVNRSVTPLTGNSAMGSTTGIMWSTGILLYAGQSITNISFRTGTTAGSAMTHWWVALYDTQATPNLIAQSSDQTSTAIGASATITVALGSPAPYTVTTTGIHYVSLMVAATTLPTVNASTSPSSPEVSGLVANQKSLAVTSGSALTATAPGTITSATASTTLLYAETS